MLLIKEILICTSYFAHAASHSFSASYFTCDLTKNQTDKTAVITFFFFLQ